MLYFNSAIVPKMEFLKVLQKEPSPKAVLALSLKFVDTETLYVFPSVSQPHSEEKDGEEE